MNSEQKVLYKFSGYLVDVAERQLTRAKDPISLTPKAFETLVVLLENRGKVVSKDVLLDRVWADTFVEEATLAQNISTVRKALSADGGQFIETVPKLGYRFTAAVEEVIGDEEIILIDHRVRTQITTTNSGTANAAASPKLASSIRQRKWLIAAGACVAIVAIGGFFALRYINRESRFSNTKFRTIATAKLSSSGNIDRVSISPDGTYLGLVEHNGDKQGISLRQVNSTDTVEILAPRDMRVVGMCFTPDSRQIYYVAYERDTAGAFDPVGHLYRLGLLGGVPQKVADDLDSGIAISPDGRQYAFVRDYPQDKQSALVVAAFDGPSNERKLAVRDIDEKFSAAGPAWSPDGRMIAAPAFRKDAPPDELAGILLLDAQNGGQSELSAARWNWVGQIAWLADGSGVVFPAYSLRSGNHTDEIWTVATPGGEARQITDGINGALGVSVTADSNTLVTVKSNRIASFWLTHTAAGDQRLSMKMAEYSSGPDGLTWASGGRVLYGMTLNGNLDIWSMNPDGTGGRQLTSDAGADFSPATSPDGQNIVFISNRSGKPNLWRMRADGTAQTQITNDERVGSPSIAPDNDTIYYSSFEGDGLRATLRTVSLTTGASTQLTSRPTFFPSVSPDGKFVACYYGDASNDRPGARLMLTILSTADSSVVKQFAGADQTALSPIGWTADGRGIKYVVSGAAGSTLYQQDVAGGPAKIIIDARPDQIFRFADSPDGKHTIYEKGDQVSDVMLVTSK